MNGHSTKKGMIARNHKVPNIFSHEDISHEGKFKTPMTHYEIITRKSKIEDTNKFWCRCGAIRSLRHKMVPLLWKRV